MKQEPKMTIFKRNDAKVNCRAMTALVLPGFVASVLLGGLTACGGAPASVSAKSPASSEAPVSKQGKESAANSGISLTKEAQVSGGIRSEAVSMSAMPITVIANGAIAVNEDRTWHVGAYVAGRVSELLANRGDSVKSGQVLLRMHSHEVHDTRAAYLQARLMLQQAEASADFAKRARDRAQRLLALQSTSQEQADRAETDWKNALSQISVAKAAVDREKTHLVEVLEIPMDENGNPADIDTVPVRAPQAGIVVERKATVGSVVSEGEPLLTIADTSSVWVIANASESDLPALRPGQRVHVRVRAFPDRDFPGQILKLGESLDPTTRTLQVRVLVPNPNGLLKPEMFASLAIEGGNSRPAITVPKDAIQDVNGKKTVFLQTSDTAFQPRAVIAGTDLADRVEITDGLKPGDRVVVQGGFGLKSEMLKSLLSEE
jgi:cobalt-zinc-cadmium efflux system membrane fusion protein